MINEKNTNNNKRRTSDLTNSELLLLNDNINR